MSKPRLQRFLGADGRCFDVAIDHGFFNEHSFLAGIEGHECCNQESGCGAGVASRHLKN